MTRLEERSELAVCWSEWLLWRNQRGMRRVLWIGLCLSPTLGVLDAMLAPERWLPGLQVMRGSATLLTLALFPAVPSAVFRRYPSAISAGYVLLVSVGISLMTVFTGGLASPYSAALVMLASGLLFVWPPRYSTKQAGHGMGLGLTITRRVVVGLGGSLRLESELGKGSELIIRVPSSLGCREAAS